MVEKEIVQKCIQYCLQNADSNVGLYYEEDERNQPA